MQDAAYAAVQLKEESAKLSDLVGQFRVDEAESLAPRRRGPDPLPARARHRALLSR
jgi:hypothetical protein